MRLLVVEDDAQLGRTLARGLRDRSYAVDLVSDGDAALYSAAMNEYDVVILDVMLPRRDGLTVARTLRARGDGAPILMLTARDGVSDRVEGLDAGADDYLVKPFAFDELLARLRALTRRGARLMPTVIHVGTLAIDTRTQTLTKNGREVVLTSKEYALLEFFARNAGAMLTRAQITAHVWDDNHDPLGNGLEVYISRLRRLIDDGESASYIQTRRGRGYAFVAPSVSGSMASEA